LREGAVAGEGFGVGYAADVGNLCTADIRRKFDEVWSMFQ
jgi:hypothetical protein